MFDIQTTIRQLSEQVGAGLFRLDEGGAGSGNWGHKGRPGARGGSLPRGSGGGGGSDDNKGKTAKARKSLHYKRKILANRQERIAKLAGQKAKYARMAKEITTIKKQVTHLLQAARAGGKDAKLKALQRTLKNFKKDTKTKEMSTKNAAVIGRAISDIKGQISKLSSGVKTGAGKAAGATTQAARTAGAQPGK